MQVTSTSDKLVPFGVIPGVVGHTYFPTLCGSVHMYHRGWSNRNALCVDASVTCIQTLFLLDFS